MDRGDWMFLQGARLRSAEGWVALAVEYEAQGLWSEARECRERAIENLRANIDSPPPREPLVNIELDGAPIPSWTPDQTPRRKPL